MKYQTQAINLFIKSHQYECRAKIQLPTNDYKMMSNMSMCQLKINNRNTFLFPSETPFSQYTTANPLLPEFSKKLIDGGS